TRTVARSRRGFRRLRADAPAARIEAIVPRMAGAALPRARRARDEPDAADARRQGLRQRLRAAHEGLGRVRGSAEAAFPQGACAAGLWLAAADQLRCLRGAAKAVAAGLVVLGAGPPAVVAGGVRRRATGAAVVARVLVGALPQRPRAPTRARLGRAHECLAAGAVGAAIPGLGLAGQRVAAAGLA